MSANTTLIREIAKMIDHSLLHPTMTDADLQTGCELARQYDVATACVKPYDVVKAAELLAGSNVLVCSVIGFPHGNNTTDLKVAETERACRDGAVEIDMVVNVGKVLSHDWVYVQAEIQAVQDACARYEAILKVIFENDYLPTDDLKIKLCQICAAVGVNYVKTSTGYGFVKGSDGRYGYEGATEHDLQLMLDNIQPGMLVKAAGGIRTLDGLLRVKEMGVARLGASATAAIMEDAYRRFGAVPADAPATNVQETSGY